MKQEILDLRQKMQEVNVDVYVVSTADSHNSEYVGEHYRIRQWLTGFTGSNGTLVVTQKDAKLWTDGRYFIQCEKELSGSEITMMKMGEPDTPTVWEYVAEVAKNSEKTFRVGFDGRTIPKKQVEELFNKSKKAGLSEEKLPEIVIEQDLAGELWETTGKRPKRAMERIRLLDKSFAGADVAEKLTKVREAMEKEACNQFFLSKLDDIMWLFNIRGNDVKFNPVALSYAFVTKERSFLFVQSEAVSEALKGYAGAFDIVICEYGDVFKFLKEYPYEGKTLVDFSEISIMAYKAISEGCGEEQIINGKNPTLELKAVKNETEIQNMREYFVKDSAAMTKYIYWLKNGEHKKLTELEAMEKIDSLRSEVKGCMGLSFTTIAAYGANAAMMHYEATEESHAICDNKGMILTDCGGQYPGATTDVTRTVALGEVSKEEIADFTYVLKGFLALMNAKWLKGCTGRNLDILARQPLWKRGIDYKCGTGHGVGCYLNVHEGPQNIRWKYIGDMEEAVLVPGMTVTDEPGVYIEGQYGIRTENTLLVRAEEENEYGQFLSFENLTWVPIDMDLVDLSILNKEEIELLNTYHRACVEKLAPYLSEEELNWLKKL